MPKESAIITEFVLDRLADEPIARRIQLTRALANITGDSSERAELVEIANALEHADRRQRKLTLRFKERRA